MTTEALERQTGIDGFDFFVGEWRARHRRLRERLAGCRDWIAFDGAHTMQKLGDGWSNIDHNVLDLPGDEYCGVTLRAFDPKTSQWAIWWLDSRNPFANLDPPVKGRFENGVGTFYADETFNGKPIRVRFIWSNITATTARWEQPFSPDGGQTWETNWIADFTRVA